MSKIFNTTGDCKSTLHYMVDITNCLIEIKKLVDTGAYFTIDRARQYGKTTTLRRLSCFLKEEYLVVSLDFQGFSYNTFRSESRFSETLIEEILYVCNDLSEEVRVEFQKFLNEETKDLYKLFRCLSWWCKVTEKPIVLLIDEVDSASNNQLFLDFLAQLRRYYLKRDMMPTFQSVILAGVYDIKNITMKIHPGENSKTNSPWNIATKFDVDMSFSATEIEGMLREYDLNHNTGMNIHQVAQLIYDYTSGYPFLVSALCKLMDETVGNREGFPNDKEIWSKDGILEAVKILLAEQNMLFDSLINKITSYEAVKNMVYNLLFSGQKVYYNPDDELLKIVLMFGFVTVSKDGMVQITNRIFETRLYNYFIIKELNKEITFTAIASDKNQFIKNGQLDMELVLEKFVIYFTDLYGKETNGFLEDEGRKYFLLFLKPIINGVGNYYIEAQTRDRKRTDVIIDYLGKQHIVEMKIWHGDEYNLRGERQLLEYMDYYHLDTGYMLSFNFNKSKQIGVKCIEMNGKM